MWSFWACHVISRFIYPVVLALFSIVHHTSLNWPRLPHNGSSRGCFIPSPPYQIAEECLQSLQNKMWCRQSFFVFFISASRPTKLVMKIRNQKNIISEAQYTFSLYKRSKE
jgi:hypothetical protein